MHEAPLREIRVADATDMRGALCGRILADLGADVARLVHPDDDGSSADRHRNAGKRRVTRSLIEAAGDADVLIENGGPRSPVDRDSLAADHPRLVIVSLSDLGLDGPRADWHLEPLPALAASGALHATGFPHLPPTALPGFLAHDCASVHGALGAVAALIDRRRTGLGQQIEISVQQAALNGTTPWSVAIPSYLSVNPFLPAEGTRNAEGFYLVLPCRDGHVRLVLASDADWVAFSLVCGEPEEFSGGEWTDRTHRMMNGETIREVAARCLADRTRAELFTQSQALGLSMGAVQSPLDFVAHPQTKGRKTFDNGITRAPWRVQPSSATVEPTPLDGGRPLLLEGIRVVEFGIAAVVPELCWMLSELGADVIKVESAKKPDTLRLAGLDDPDRSFCFNMECRGRRGITLDLTSEEGRRLARELCLTADVVAENNRGGMMAKLGLDYDDLVDDNPGLVYVASQGYGRGGPMGEMKAWGPLNACFSGVQLLWSHPDGPYPCGTSLNHPDHIAGKLLATAVLAQLDERSRTGRGGLIEMAQTEAAVYLLGELYLEAIETGIDPVNLANRDRVMAPHGVYPAEGDDRWIAIAVQDDEAWAALERVCGWEPSPELAAASARREAQDVIDERVAAWTSLRDGAEAAAELQAAGVSAMPVMGPLDHLADPQLEQRGLMVDLVHPHHGPERQPANPTRMSRTQMRTAQSAPRLGADTDEVLREVLGLDDPAIARLRAAGALT